LLRLPADIALAISLRSHSTASRERIHYQIKRNGKRDHRTDDINQLIDRDFVLHKQRQQARSQNHDSYGSQQTTMITATASSMKMESSSSSSSPLKRARAASSSPSGSRFNSSLALSHVEHCNARQTLQHTRPLLRDLDSHHASFTSLREPRTRTVDILHIRRA
jgi:hypothetical protein